ncbi:MAG: DMT family transporter [Deferrisomatales bacterium]|nr:DMT family transporter [Deferrisomatales bacterium]
MRGGGALQIAGAMVLWSSWGLFVRWLPVPPWAVSFYVALFSATAAALAWLAAGHPLAGLWPRRHGVALGLIGVFFLVNNVAYLTALQLTTVANAVLTHYTAPVFVALAAPFTLGERRLPFTPAALLLSMVGVGLLLPGVELQLGDRHLQGLAMGLVSGVAYAALVLLARHYSLRVAVLPLIFMQNLVVTVALLPLGVRLGPLGASTLGILALLGLVHATVGGVLYLVGIRRVRAQAAAILGYLEPLGAVLLAAWFLGEQPGALALVGGTLILVAGALVVWDENRQCNRIDSLPGPG